MLREYQLDPHMLHLEVTETAYISNMEQAAEMLARLRKIGIKIALDDFGMGYAGLNYLQHLPVDIIKIDKTLSTRSLPMTLWFVLWRPLPMCWR